MIILRNNMKSLKDIIQEGILADVDTVINQTDQLFADAEKEFNDLKKFALDKKNWKITGSARKGQSKYIKINYKQEVSNLIKFLNVRDREIGVKYFQFDFYKNSMVKYYKGGFHLWDNDNYMIYFGGTKYQYGTFIEQGNGEYKDEKDLLKKFLIPLFKDFNTFIQTCNTALSRK